MALVATNMALIEAVLGNRIYWYDAGTDDLAAVMASGYFDDFVIENPATAGEGQVLNNNDVIFVKAADGLKILRVDNITTAGVVTTEVGPGESQILSVDIDDLAAASSHWTVSPMDGFINRVWSVIEGAVNADTAVGIELGGVDVTGAQLTITASGSAAGDVDTGTATAANAVSEGGAIEVTCDGAGSTSSKGRVFIEIVPL